MIKVLHVVESFGGGVQTYFSGLLNEVSKEVSVQCTLAYSCREETVYSDIRNIPKNISLVELPTLYDNKSFVSNVKWFLIVYRLIKNNGYDVIHFHSSKAGAMGRLACLFLGVRRHFYTPHGYSFLRQDISAFSRSIFMTAERLLNVISGGVVVACSASEGKYAKKCWAKKVTVVDNAVQMDKLVIDVEEFSSVQSVCTKKLRVGIVGRVTSARNPDLFIQIFEYFKVRYPGSIEFVWVGDGEPTFTKSLKKVGVELTGWVSRDAALTYMAGFDIYIQTSLWEGMPYSVIEAQCIGIPVVASNIIGNKDIVVNGKSGYLANSYSDFISSIESLLDEETRIEMSKYAFLYARKRFSTVNQMQRFMELYLSKEGGTEL